MTNLHSKRGFQNMSIRRKLLTIMLVSVLLICCVSLGGFQLVILNYNQMIFTQTSSALNVIADKVGARLDTLMEISLNTAVNKVFQNDLATVNQHPLTAADGIARSRITSLLYSTFHSDLISISIIPYAGNPIVVGAVSSQESDSVLKRAAALAAEAKGAPVWLSTGRADASMICAREIHNVTRPFLEPMGLLLMRVNLGRIVRESAQPILTGAYDIAINQYDELLYPYAESYGDVFDESIFDGDERFTIVRKNDGRRFVTRSDVRAFRLSWSLVLGVPYDDVFRTLIVANISFVGGLLGAAVLAMLFSRRMLAGINQSVQLLTSKMNRVQSGDLTPYPNPITLDGDELGRLNTHFDKMTADFKQVIDDNYVKELLLTQTQLKALMQQINPHFLYNSLDSINWFARRGDGKAVSSIAQALGSLLRCTISENEDLIPLRRELDILDSYLRIQRIRFTDTLKVDTQVDVTALDALIPKMSIQPLVENAIVHALEENVGDCHIRPG
jgi:two-component system sensor histidine kinase YesM